MGNKSLRAAVNLCDAAVRYIETRPEGVTPEDAQRLILLGLLALMTIIEGVRFSPISTTTRSAEW